MRLVDQHYENFREAVNLRWRAPIAQELPEPPEHRNVQQRHELCAAQHRMGFLCDVLQLLLLQADAFSGDTALRIRPGVAARSNKLSPSPHSADDIESSTPPSASSGGLAAAFAEGAGSGDGSKSLLAWKPLQGRAQQVVLLCWMHGAIGYGYFVMQVRASTASPPMN